MQHLMFEEIDLSRYFGLHLKQQRKKRNVWKRWLQNILHRLLLLILLFNWNPELLKYEFKVRLCSLTVTPLVGIHIGVLSVTLFCSNFICFTCWNLSFVISPLVVNGIIKNQLHSSSLEHLLPRLILSHLKCRVSGLTELVLDLWYSLGLEKCPVKYLMLIKRVL